MRLGLIGCGTIGRALARSIAGGELEGFELVAVLDRNPWKAEEISRLTGARSCNNIDDLLQENLDLVVEAASQQAVREYAERILDNGFSLVIMSVGALMDDELLSRLVRTAEMRNARILVPSGAIGGLDALRSVRRELDMVILETSKNPSSLEGAPFFSERGIDPGEITSRTILYEGSAREAVRLFPQNINVAATICLAVGDPDKVRVRVVADPSLSRNVHEILAKGSFGELRLRFENERDPGNPRTSRLAYLSLLELLRSLRGSLRVGT